MLRMNNATTITPKVVTTIHPFERAGLGKAPFRCVGSYEKKFQACLGAPILPGGTCDYCGQGIMYVCMIRSADGKTFNVGCDCVAKLERTDNARSSLSLADRQLIAEAKRIANQAKKVTRDARNEAKIAELEAILADEGHRAKLAAIDHPYDRPGGYVAYADWMKLNAGVSGKVRLLGFVKKHLGL